MTAIARLSLFATLLGAACAQDTDHHDDPESLAVVFTAADGLTLTVGSYDQDSGELTFVARAQDDMRERLGAAGYRALVDDAGELVEVDLDAGVAVVAAELEDGDVLDLRIAGADRRTITLGRLVLSDADALDPAWRRLGNKVWPDDWLSPV